MKRHYFLIFICWSTNLFAPQITITQPGLTVIDASRDYAPDSPNDCCVEVSTSDAIIEFNNHSITQRSDNQMSGLDGIRILPNLSNITIQNATIKHLSGSGIHIQDGCQNIRLLSNTISGCNTAGIFVDGISSGTGVIAVGINSCSISTCTGSQGSPAYGIRIAHTANVNIESNFIGYCNAGITASSYGLSLESCTNCFVNLLSTSEGGGNPLCAGIAALNCNACTFQQVQSLSNRAYDLSGTGSCCGFLLQDCENLVVRNCRAMVNQSILSQSQSFGFLSIHGINTRIRESTASGNSAGAYTAGISLINETKSTILDCVIEKNETTITGTAYGIVLSGTANNLCECKNNLISSNLSAGGFGYGIIDERSPSTSLFMANYAFNNNTNYSVTYGNGVLLSIFSSSISSPLINLQSNFGDFISGYDNVSVTA